MSSSDGSTPPEQVDQILASSSLVRAIENDRYKHLLDNVPVAVAVSRGSGSDQQIVYVNGAFEGLTGLTALTLKADRGLASIISRMKTTLRKPWGRRFPMDRTSSAYSGQYRIPSVC